MTIKQCIWLMLGVYLVSYNPVEIFNGLDLLGWMVLLYTIYRIIEDFILSIKYKNSWKKIILK